MPQANPIGPNVPVGRPEPEIVETLLIPPTPYEFDASTLPKTQEERIRALEKIVVDLANRLEALED